MPSKLKSLLILADSTSHIIVPVKTKPIYINCINRIFPAIHESKPDCIILDHDFLGNDIEKILRRLMSNHYYRSIKICCYKSKPHTKVDDLLKALGVQQFIYAAKKETPVSFEPAKASNWGLKNIFSSKLALRFIH